ncbi:MAG: Smr/MutS family protein [Myxococcota bacterium]|nr:Smr/MutS family protein [Myxococcota bacterium]
MLTGDVSRLRSALAVVEDGARAQVWDERRPWRVRTHIGVEHGRPSVDLHDLKARNARLALDCLVAVAPQLESGSVLVVTGRGTHSLGPPVLQRMTGERLAAVAARTEGWALHPHGSGAWVLSTQPSAAPARRSNWFLVVFFLLTAAALVWLLAGRPAGALS